MVKQVDSMVSVMITVGCLCLLFGTVTGQAAARADPAGALKVKSLKGATVSDSSTQMLQVQVRWNEGDRTAPYVVALSPVESQPPENLIGMRVDRALEILRRGGWRMQRFEMQEYWNDPGSSKQEYTLERG